MTSVTYSVPGISCGHCVAAIGEEVEKVPGVSGFVVSLDDKTVTVTGDDVEVAAVLAAIDEAGYEVAE